MALLPLSVLGAANCSSPYVSSMPANAQNLLLESMAWMDTFYDASAGYLYDVSAASALRHETRSSAWYAVGLLARNQGTDVEEAVKIITNVIDGQLKDPMDQWQVATLHRVEANRLTLAHRYGDYQQEPEEPTLDTRYYPGKPRQPFISTSCARYHFGASKSVHEVPRLTPHSKDLWFFRPQLERLHRNNLDCGT
jgi:hypothetical protein